MHNDDTSPPKPLAVDLDGTLIPNDTTNWLFWTCARAYPLLILPVLIVLAVNRAAAKMWMVKLVGDRFDPARLEYVPEALALIEAHKARGGEVGLVSGSNHAIVTQIAQHLGVFDYWQGTQTGPNLTSANKAAFLMRKHPDGFAYAGNSRQDFAVWRVCGEGYGFHAPHKAYALKTHAGEDVALTCVIARA